MLNINFVTCIKGCIFDVAVDLRKESKRILSFSVQLDQFNKLSLMIPPDLHTDFKF